MNGEKWERCLPAQDIEALERGVEHFNSGRYFEAHEDWEAVWRVSEQPLRSQLKALIQSCGVLLHLQKRKWNPAERLCRRALELFAEAAAHEALLGEPVARILVPGLEEGLIEAEARLILVQRSPESEPELIQRETHLRSLRAALQCESS